MKLRFFPIAIERGSGSTLYDADGKEYLDFNSGWGVANVGYCNSEIIEAAYEQMKKLSFNCLISASNLKSVELAEKLISLAPGDFEKKVWFGHSGSDANEFIAKIVPKATGRPRIMTFVGSYHGQTMGSYAMSGHPAQSRMIAGGNIIKSPYPYCYRCPFNTDENKCGCFCAEYIEEYVLKTMYDPYQVGAIVIEAIQSDGGDIVPPNDFLKEIERICRKYEILLIFDEVKIGFGRTGKFFGFQNWDIVPDAIVIGKPIAGGLPLSAVIGRKELMDAGYAAHMFTTAGDPVSCVAALKTIEIVERNQLAENAEKIGLFLLRELRKLKEKYECIGDVRGCGLILGVEFVKNKATRAPDKDMAALVVYDSFLRGLLYYGTGIFENVLEFTPPLVLTLPEAKRAISILEKSIAGALSGEITLKDIEGFSGWGMLG
jgi:4-aminobutyrate aminotransferase